MLRIRSEQNRLSLGLRPVCSADCSLENPGRFTVSDGVRAKTCLNCDLQPQDEMFRKLEVDPGRFMAVFANSRNLDGGYSDSICNLRILLGFFAKAYSFTQELIGWRGIYPNNLCGFTTVVGVSMRYV